MTANGITNDRAQSVVQNSGWALEQRSICKRFYFSFFYIFWTVLIPHRQLREKVNEVLRWEHHRGIQWNHKASPQCQVQICCQLLHTHRDWLWGISSRFGSLSVLFFFPRWMDFTLLKSWRMYAGSPGLKRGDGTLMMAVLSEISTSSSTCGR